MLFNEVCFPETVVAIQSLMSFCYLRVRTVLRAWYLSFTTADDRDRQNVELAVCIYTRGRLTRPDAFKRLVVSATNINTGRTKLRLARNQIHDFLQKILGFNHQRGCVPFIAKFVPLKVRLVFILNSLGVWDD